MKPIFALLPIAFLTMSCSFRNGPRKIPSKEADGYVFYKGLERFLSDGTELEPLVKSVVIDGQEVVLDRSFPFGNCEVVRRGREWMDCYVANGDFMKIPEDKRKVYRFSYCYPTGEKTELSLVPGLTHLPRGTLPGIRDRHGSGIIRDGVRYAAPASFSAVHASKRGAYEAFLRGPESHKESYLGYRPLEERDGVTKLGERTKILKTKSARFVDVDPSSPDRYFFTEGEDPRWYRFSEETLKLEDLGPFEADRYRFLDLKYERHTCPTYGIGEPTSTRYLVLEEGKTFFKDLGNPSYLLDVTDRIPSLDCLSYAGYAEDIGLFYYNNRGYHQADCYLECEKRWVGADIYNESFTADGNHFIWDFTYPLFSTNRYDFRVRVDNWTRGLGGSRTMTHFLLRADRGSEIYGYTDTELESHYNGWMIFPFRYDYVDTQGDEILEIAPSMPPMMNAPK